MSEPRYLVDTSVLIRASIERVGRRLEELAVAGKVWTCRVVDLEAISSARKNDVADLIEERLQFPHAPVTPAVLERALQVAGLMAEAGVHRGTKPNDLIIAAAAETTGLTVLHYDKEYDRIAAVTGQPTRWVAPAGTLDH